MKTREETEIRIHAEETYNYREQPFKEATTGTNKPSVASNQTKEIALKWKEDKENLEEVTAYNTKTDKDI
jgi:hypothetical protein